MNALVVQSRLLLELFLALFELDLELSLLPSFFLLLLLELAQLCTRPVELLVLELEFTNLLCQSIVLRNQILDVVLIFQLLLLVHVLVLLGFVLLL